MAKVDFKDLQFNVAIEETKQLQKVFRDIGYVAPELAQPYLGQIAQHVGRIAFALKLTRVHTAPVDKQETAQRLVALRRYVEDEYTAIREGLGAFAHPRLTGHLVELDDGRTADLQREADAIAEIGALLREALDPRAAGTLRSAVRRALGYWK